MAEYVKKHGLSLAAVCACMAIGALLTLALSSLLPEAQAQQVLPGGKAARMHSYSGEGGPAAEWRTLIESAPGDHGFLITDVIVGSGYDGVNKAELRVDDVRVFMAFSSNSNNSFGHHFESGIIVPAGSTVTYWADDFMAYTVSGYEF